ncbi:hypothetical protein FD13_GL001250 [Levilactobacillus senmaizukei DSM 21775 = NBRC 103853]|uniref:Uncharacterized protein n=1 Tax=Levilactobacillus senmaizukei DSM 21775 = NBRC 103853 TaxID=1423803 RepID=A0A0R2DH30_9LACO|nr:hypothetical protein [Levilactobacillus senmaizukei]KRN02934.1 hypothetical protein FD13_GL001250 [Levilactobacillus senmaizukei DSM 21775 = NBRC 103853]
MANTKNSQAAKIRQQIMTWLQDDQITEVASDEKFPGIRGLRAVTLRQMLGDQGYTRSVVMGAVSAAPSIDGRIKKAAVTPRQVYYYFDSKGPAPKRQHHPAAAPKPAAKKSITKPKQTTSAPTKVAASSTATPVSSATTAPIASAAPASQATVTPTATAGGIVATNAFEQLMTTNTDLANQVDALLTAAQVQRPLSDLDLDFLSNFATAVTRQSELLRNYATQSKIEQLRS